MEAVIVGGIVLAAAGWVFFHFRNAAGGKGGCSGCGKCGGAGAVKKHGRY